MKNKNIRVVVGVLVVLVVVALLVSNSDSGSEIKIGIMAPLSGWRADGGAYLKDGYNLAFEEADIGLIKNIKLIYEDTKCDPKEAITVLNKLRSIDNVDLFMGPHCGTETKVAEIFAEDNKVVIVSPGDNFGKINEYFFSINTPIAKDGEEAARYMIDDGITKTAVIYFNNEWGATIYKAFVEEFVKLGGVVTSEEPHEPEETDFRTHITKAMADKPEAIFLTYAPNAVRQIKEIGQDVAIYTTWYFEEPQIKESYGIYSEGVKYPYPKEISKEEYSSFVQRFNERYNYDPPLLSVTSYINMKLGLKIIEKCGRDKLCMQEELLSTSQETMIGPLTFNDDFWGIDKEYEKKIFRDGEFALYE